MVDDCLARGLSSCLALRLSGNETDRLALLEIKARITNDPVEALTSWNETNHFCNWRGVTCGRHHKRVTVFNLECFKLSGSLSPHVGNLSFLRVLSLTNNNFRHKIPPEIGRFPRMQDIVCENNSLTGEIPSNLSRCSQLSIIAFGGNFLVGKLPEELGTFVKVKNNFKYNKVSGRIPHGIGNLANLESICFAKNQFSESIPPDVGKLRRKHLTGLLPKSLLKATDGFSSVNLIGMGSFGSVYEGVLEQGETTIAVKVLNLVRLRAYKSFISKCEALRNIRHRNLIKILSACSGFDYHRHNFKALIYEFMVNGSFEEWLHPTLQLVSQMRGQGALTFSERLNIVNDVALALDYLHHHCETRIVHYNLKPSNMLLNEDMIQIALHNHSNNNFQIALHLSITLPSYSKNG
ncbi:probable LRR receptor-like serine/threonine-protein kinase At3g47570 [Pyrus x bretschneideri]|uniref:probable LRR receptor-like serine/threonine-protein kinase At3g47570 n=1 Tax=Pyrus x bretschneideri TaxID=225117 RepID=UPI002030A4A6|nr:probable LRR receptor-like serine/threonine-protein kinase At3g47570 [Pyrus x bretschneideri]